MKGLGHHFGGSGAPFWSHFGGLGGFWLPNASWKASWAALGRFSEPRWLQLGAQEGPKLEPKRCKNWWENRLKIRWLWKSIFEGILVDFGKDFGTKIDAEIDVIFERRFFEKTSFFPWKNTLFWHPRGPSWEQKPIKNQSKFEVQDGVPLGIDFWCILVVFWRQVGRGNRANID